MSVKIRIGQLRLAVPATPAASAIPAAQALAKSVAAQLAATLPQTPSVHGRREIRSLRVQLPRGRAAAADIARAIRKALEER
jgi:hypothetical protein